MAYRSVFGESYCERVVEKSRFLTYAAHVEGEEDAKKYLAGVRAAHPLATHVCYGYIADKTGNLQRFSDDGEPQGTAGMPVLGVIKAQKLFETAVAVVRYFGGIKLGAGGLTRAYAVSASEGLERAEIRNYDICAETEFTVGYPEADALTRFLRENGVSVVAREFGERARFVVAVREGELKDFCEKAYDRLGGKTQIKEIKRYYYPFPL